MVDRVHDLLTQTFLPDAVPAAPAGGSTLEPLPQATPSEILGLVETLAGYGGPMGPFGVGGPGPPGIGRGPHAGLGAEMLDFVDTPRRLVMLTPLGRALVDADTPEQQRIFRQQIRTIHLVQTVLDMLQRVGPVDRDDVLDHLALHLPNQDPYRLLDTLL